jgi:hypothetical protein
MPYTKDELDNLVFYQGLITGDESKENWIWDC